MHNTPHFTQKLTRRIALASVSLFLFIAHTAQAAEIRVITSGAFTEAYKQLAPMYEQATGHKIISSYGASIGNAPDSIPTRFARGEKFDLVILSEGGLEALMKEGKLVKGSRVDLARSQIGAAVRKGTPKPDISTVEALKKTLLDAKSIAYSASASGTYLSTELFPKLGVAEQMKVTAKRIMSERVGAVVARGDAELGFQQVSELIYFKELDFIGTLPESVQQTIFFSSALVEGSTEQEIAKHFVKFLTSPSVAKLVRETGLDPATSK
jgi:molybdate transport system substrate-binding protein